MKLTELEIVDIFTEEKEAEVSGLLLTEELTA